MILSVSGLGRVWVNHNAGFWKIGFNQKISTLHEDWIFPRTPKIIPVTPKYLIYAAKTKYFSPMAGIVCKDYEYWGPGWKKVVRFHGWENFFVNMCKKAYSFTWCVICTIGLCRVLPPPNEIITLQWRYNESHGVSKHRRYGFLLNRLLRRTSKKTSKLHVTGLGDGNSPVTG